MTTQYLRVDSVREDGAHAPDPGFVRNEKGQVTVVHHGAEQPAAPVPLMAPAAVPDPDPCDDALTPPQYYKLNESIGQFDQGSQRYVRRPAGVIEDPWRYPFWDGK